MHIFSSMYPYFEIKDSFLWNWLTIKYKLTHRSSSSSLCGSLSFFCSSAWFLREEVMRTEASLSPNLLNITILFLNGQYRIQNTPHLNFRPLFGGFTFNFLLLLLNVKLCLGLTKCSCPCQMTCSAARALDNMIKMTCHWNNVTIVTNSDILTPLCITRARGQRHDRECKW